MDQNPDATVLDGESLKSLTRLILGVIVNAPQCELMGPFLGQHTLHRTGHEALAVEDGKHNIHIHRLAPLSRAVSRRSAITEAMSATGMRPAAT